MPAWVVPAAIAAGGAIINAFQGWRARKVNEGYVRQQNVYNSPRSQMQRFQAAGLNPNLVYTQGNPGNQSTTLTQPEGLQRGGSDFVSGFNQSSLAQSQVQTQSVQRSLVRAKTEIAGIQADVLRNNPFLDRTYVSAVVQSMIATALQKTNQARIGQVEADWFTSDLGTEISTKGKLKMETDLNRLVQQYDLGTLDQKVKAEIIQSKEFQNSLLEMEEKWMRDLDISPGHILQGLKLLIQKFR